MQDKIVACHNPVGKTDYLSIQHIERYRFAVSKLRPGMRVLDIASGAGYGTAMLLKHGCEVVGGDCDDGVLADAQRLWNHKDFINVDALDLPFDGASFDAVVSFETIEHVDHGRRFLSEMYRVLRPGGIFICSTPNIRYTAHPPFHIKEYKLEEFFKLVEAQFGATKRYGQYFRVSDRVRDLFRWWFCGNLVKILERTGTKDWIKKILGRDWAASIQITSKLS